MPCDFIIDKQHRLVLSQATGVFTAQDALDHAERLRRHPDFSPDFSQLFDLSPVTELRLTSEEVRMLTKVTNYLPTARRAIVAPSPHLFGIARMYELIRSSSAETREAIQVFSDRAQALRWLDCGVE